MASSDDLDLEDFLLIGLGAIVTVQLFRFLQAQGGFSFPGSAPGSPANLLAALPMQVSPSGRVFIQSMESFSAKPYPDAGGRAVYWGHRITANDPAITGTMAQANEFFDGDIANVEAVLNSSVTVTLSQPQYDALADLVYNIGGNAFKTSTLLKKLNAGDYQGAAQQILAWNQSQGQANADLTARRQADQNKFTGTG